jgi:hypothetical protein
MASGNDPKDESSHSEGNTRKVSFRVTPDEWRALFVVSKAQAVTVREGFRRAISLYKFFHDATMAGDEVILVHRDGNRHQVQFEQWEISNWYRNTFGG